MAERVMKPRSREFLKTLRTKCSNTFSTSANSNHCASVIANESPTRICRTLANCRRCLPGIFADAAGRAREAGFDGVELHYAHAYTMAGFLSALNDRADGYGGATRESRALAARSLSRGA